MQCCVIYSLLCPSLPVLGLAVMYYSGGGGSVRVRLFFSVVSYFFGGVGGWLGWLEKLEIKLSQLNCS